MCTLWKRYGSRATQAQFITINHFCCCNIAAWDAEPFNKDQHAAGIVATFIWILDCQGGITSFILTYYELYDTYWSQVRTAILATIGCWWGLLNHGVLVILLQQKRATLPLFSKLLLTDILQVDCQSTEWHERMAFFKEHTRIFFLRHEFLGNFWYFFSTESVLVAILTS